MKNRKNIKGWDGVFSMFNECKITKIQLDTFQGKSDWYEIINYFECSLRENYKGRYTIDAVKNVKQYIDWYFSMGIDKGSILSKENFSEYEIYLENVKKYKKSTILYKMVALHKLISLVTKLNYQNSNEEPSNHSKKNRSHYNYLTKMYIML